MIDPQSANQPLQTAPACTPDGPAEPARPRRTAPGATQTAVELGRVRAVIDALPEAVFVTEADGTLRLTNPAADRLFAGHPVRDRSDLLARFEEVAPNRPRGRPITASPDEPRRNLTVRPRNQPNRWFALRSVPLDLDPDTTAADGRAEADGPGPEPGVRDAPGPRSTRGSGGEPCGHTVFVLRDVTDSRDLQPVREAFLSVLSHELRTPITTIYAGSSVLARRPTMSPPATRTLALDISAEAARLYDLVEDLLVLARLERRALEPLDEPVLVQRAVDATIRIARDRMVGPIERRGDADVPPVHGDGTYVEQACRNLILASIRYAGTEPGRELVVDVRSDAEADEVLVAVLDRGPGLSPEDLDRAFELPDPSAVGRLAGSGVGPFVCRHLVEAMGGRVWARNRPDGGLETGFALPIDKRG